MEHSKRMIMIEFEKMKKKNKFNIEEKGFINTNFLNSSNFFIIFKKNIR